MTIREQKLAYRRCNIIDLKHELKSLVDNISDITRFDVILVEIEAEAYRIQRKLDEEAIAEISLPLMKQG